MKLTKGAGGGVECLSSMTVTMLVYFVWQTLCDGSGRGGDVYVCTFVHLAVISVW